MKAHGLPELTSEQPGPPPSEASPETLRADFVVRDPAWPSRPYVSPRWMVAEMLPVHHEQGPISPLLRAASGAVSSGFAIEDCFGRHALAPSELQPILPVATRSPAALRQPVVPPP